MALPEVKVEIDVAESPDSVDETEPSSDDSQTAHPISSRESVGVICQALDLRQVRVRSGCDFSQKSTPPCQVPVLSLEQNCVSASAMKSEPRPTTHDSQVSSFNTAEFVDSKSSKLRIKLADIKREPVSDESEEMQNHFSGASQGEEDERRYIKAETHINCSLSSAGVIVETANDSTDDSEGQEGIDSLPIHFSPNGVKSSAKHQPLATRRFEKAPPTAKFYQCGVCLQAYNDPSLLKKHMLGHRRSGLKKPLQCGVCGKAFRYVSDVIQHSVVHTGERHHRCDLCQSSFTAASSLREHAKVHTGERPFPCDQCMARFRHASQLKEHMRTHTGEKPYQCDICEVFFSSRSYMKLHRKIHTGDRRYKCDQCAMEFNQTLHLETHKRIHTGEKPFKCEICSLTYRYKSSLKTHIVKAHFMEKPHKCESCAAAFKSPEALKTHMKTHESSEKTYNCLQCSAKFLSSAGLYQHKWTHTGEKPYKCGLCPAAFRDSTTMKRHREIHSGEGQFKCEQCSASFHRMSTLSCHTKLHNEGGSEPGQLVSENVQSSELSENSEQVCSDSDVVESKVKVLSEEQLQEDSVQGS
ncbi:zinc finger protein 723-like [Littorina saxatilis]|uniref:zinc finger protein 723-like n=1 Tax=Littorina saxatilis TaxID=31220 RepID=UPI0038B51CF8